MKALRLVWAAPLGGVVTYTGVIFGLMASGRVDVSILDPAVMNTVGALVIVYMAAG